MTNLHALPVLFFLIHRSVHLSMSYKISEAVGRLGRTRLESLLWNITRCRMVARIL